MYVLPDAIHMTFLNVIGFINNQRLRLASLRHAFAVDEVHHALPPP
jgi:hypothetical protein